MINFLSETLEALRQQTLTSANVLYVICEDRYCLWDDFVRYADFEYDNGYGIEEIPMALKIVLDDGAWFERVSYDGAEWWDYKRPENIEGLEYDPDLIKYAQPPVEDDPPFDYD